VCWTLSRSMHSLLTTATVGRIHLSSSTPNKLKRRAWKSLCMEAYCVTIHRGIRRSAKMGKGSSSYKVLKVRADVTRTQRMCELISCVCAYIHVHVCVCVCVCVCVYVNMAVSPECGRERILGRTNHWQPVWDCPLVCCSMRQE